MPRQAMREPDACGFIQLQSKRIAEAEQHLSRAARAYERIGDRCGFAWVRHMTGKVLRCKGKLPEALAAHAEARTIFQSIDLAAGEMVSIVEMAGLQTAQGNDELALALFDQATDLTKAPGLHENVEVFRRVRSSSRKQLPPSCGDSEGR